MSYPETTCRLGVPRSKDNPGDSASAALVKAFAAARGCSVRTAQRHRNQESDEWLEFTTTGRVGPDEPAAEAAPEAPPELSLAEVPRPDTGDPLADEVAWCRAVRNRCIDLGREDLVTTWTSNLSKAIDLQNKELATRARTGKDLGSLVAWSKVLPPLERMGQTMAESLLEVIMGALREVAPGRPASELRSVAERARDEAFRAWCPERLVEGAAA